MFNKNKNAVRMIFLSLSLLFFDFLFLLHFIAGRALIVSCWFGRFSLREIEIYEWNRADLWSDA